MKTLSIYERNPRVLSVLRFTFPTVVMMVFASMYGIVDGIFLSNFIGSKALSANNIVYPLVTVMMAVNLMFATGSNAIIAKKMGEGKQHEANSFLSVVVIVSVGVTALLSAIMLVFDTQLYSLLGADAELMPYCVSYGTVIISGSVFYSLQILFQNFLVTAEKPAAGMSLTLAAGAVHIALDLLFVLGLHAGVAGAAAATVLAQALSAVGILLCFLRMPALHPGRAHMHRDGALLARIASVSVLTSSQQSIMNFGILMIQSLVNSFGVATMAAFAAGVKIDAFAYSPAQDFANGFATFVAQNAGAGKPERVRRGLREACVLSLSFCLLVSALVFLFARPLLTLFIDPGEAEILAIGARYLRMEGVFYVGIGMLFLLYATYRGLERAGMSVVLTVISLGLRVLIAYAFAPRFGVTAIWLAIPIGWFVADAVGLLGLRRAL